MHINIVHFFSKTLGGGGENNPVRPSISDQCYFYAKYDKNASTRACFFKFFREQNTSWQECSQIVCSYNLFFFYNK